MSLSPKMAKIPAMAELVRIYPTDFSGQNLPMRVNFMREKDPKQWVAGRDRPEAVAPHPHTLHQSRWIMGRGDISAIDTFSCRLFGEVPLHVLFFDSKNVAISPALICFLCSQSGEPGTQQLFYFASFGIYFFYRQSGDVSPLILPLVKGPV
jgi:hypothetical protein